jgi:hypothetical protein
MMLNDDKLSSQTPHHQERREDDDSSQWEEEPIHDARPLLPKASFFLGDLRDGLPMVRFC